VHQVSSFSAASPSSALTVSQVAHSLESLPIVDGKSMISLHFTPPATEVVGSGETFDIETLDKVTYDLQMKIAKTSKVSISYDV
jgi:hypothetical protein